MHREGKDLNQSDKKVIAVMVNIVIFFKLHCIE